MIAVACAALSVAAFVLGLVAFRVVATARATIATADAARRTMTDATLSDADKETAVQRASLRLLKNFVGIAAGGGAAVLLGAGVVVAADASRLAASERVLGLLLSWEGIVTTTLGLTLLAAGVRARRGRLA